MKFSVYSSYTSPIVVVGFTTIISLHMGLLPLQLCGPCLWDFNIRWQWLGGRVFHSILLPHLYDQLCVYSTLRRHLLSNSCGCKAQIFSWPMQCMHIHGSKVYLRAPIFYTHIFFCSNSTTILYPAYCECN